MKQRRMLGTLAALAVLALSLPARADYVSRTYLFDQSNALPDMLHYGSVTIEAYDGKGDAVGDLPAGQVRLTFQAETLPVYGPPNPRFGFRAVGLNTDLSLDAGQISVPAGWQLRQDRFMGGFGRFAWQAYAKPKDSLAALVVTIDGLGENATLDHFLFPSKTSGGEVPREGSVYFAARVGGFDINTDDIDATNHVVGTGFPLPPPTGPGEEVPPELPPGEAQQPPTDNPEPATLVLCGLGAGGFGLVHWVRRRKPTVKA